MSSSAKTLPDWRSMLARTLDDELPHEVCWDCGIGEADVRALGEAGEALLRVARLATEIYYETHPVLRKAGTWVRLREALAEAGLDVTRE